MSMQRAERFIRALEALEKTGDVEQLVQLFADNCEVRNALTGGSFRGLEGAREFWREYHGTLTEVRSRFRNVIVAGDRVALEWVTEGRAFNGSRVEYEGVSVLEFSGEKVVRFMAYFSPLELREQGRAEEREGGSPPPEHV